MTYVHVKEETEDKLHLTREPSIRAWSILVALIALGFGAAYYSADYLLWKLAYISGAVFVGLSCMEDWEECVLDKKEEKVIFRKESLIQKMFQAKEGPKVVVGNLNELIAVRVQEEEVKYAGVGHLVVLLFSPGYSIGITDTATLENRGEHEAVAAKVSSFVKLDSSSMSSPEIVDDNSSTSEESFEHVDKADLVNELDEPEMPENDNSNDETDRSEQSDPKIS